MRTLLMLAVVVVFAPAALVAADAKSERVNLEGKWIVTALTGNGEEVPGATLRQIPWVWMIDAKKIISRRPGAGGKIIHEEEMEFALDPSKSPKAVDVTDVARKETSKGIYELADDNLKLCIAMKPSGERPTGFDAKKGTEWVSIRMVRVSRPVTIETPKPRLVLEGHTGSVDAVAVSPDGKTIVSGGYEYTVRFWDAATGKPSGSIQVERAVNSLAYSPDGKWLAIGGRNRLLQVWNVAAGKVAVTFEGHKNDIDCVVWSPDGKALASASQDNTLKLWDATTGKMTADVPYGEAFVMAVAWSPDGKTLAVGTSPGFRDNAVHLLDAATGKKTGELPGHYGGIYGLAFSPDGKLLASVGWHSIRKLWDMETKKEKVKLQDDSSNAITKFSWVRFSPDGKLLATQGGKLNNLCLHDVATGKLIVVFEAHEKEKSTDAAAFTPDGKSLVTGSWDRTVKVWNLPIAKTAKK